MKVNVGRGIERDVDTSALAEDVMVHVVYIGLRNILMDAHAGAAKDGGTEAEIKARAEAIVDKKLDALYRGEIRTAGERSRTTDPVKREAKRLATDYAKRRPDWKDLSASALAEKVTQLLALPNSQFMRIAEENVARMADLGEIDID
jgi:predicted NodU family carbamoyl transferase